MTFITSKYQPQQTTAGTSTGTSKVNPPKPKKRQ